MNMKRAINVVMNGAVAKSFRCLARSQLGSQTFKATDCPQETIESLQGNWGLTTPGGKAEDERKWSARWNPTNPIKELFDRFEECYTIAIVAFLSYLME